MKSFFTSSFLFWTILFLAFTVQNLLILRHDVAQALVKIGEIQVCAERFEWSGIYGPSIELWKEGQK